jgi:hypothetical protein
MGKGVKICVLTYGLISTNAFIAFTFCHPELVSGSEMNWFWMLKQVQHDTLYNAFTLVIDVLGSARYKQKT